MIVHKDFESNCKRIAKYIMKESSNPSSEQFDDMIDLGVITVKVSESVIADFKKVGEKKYIKEINNNLKGCYVKFRNNGYRGYCYLKFEIEFDDVDPEVEDW